MVEPSGGYDYQFVETPADFMMCVICHRPSREPFLSVCCGHTFCNSCLCGLKQKTDSCPMCRSEEFVTIPNKQVDRLVRGLRVFCTNKEKGCEWQGEVNDIVSHIEDGNGCHFQEVKCPFECGKCLQRQNLISHVQDECVRRKVECQYCHITEEYQFVSGEHKELCPKFPLPCPNNCNAGTIPRESIDEHRKICLFEEVTCILACGTYLQRQDLTSHVQTQCPCRKVNCQYCNVVGEYQIIEGDHKKECPKFPVLCPNKCDVGRIPRDDVDEHLKTCPLEVIQCEYHMMGCHEKVARKDQEKHNKEKVEEHLSFTKDALIMKVGHTSKEQADTVDSLTVELQETKNALAVVKNELAATLENLKLTKQEFEQAFATVQENLVNTQHQLAHAKDVLRDSQQRTHDELVQNFVSTERHFNKKTADIENRLQNLEKTHQIDYTQFNKWYKKIYTLSSEMTSGNQVVPVVVCISGYTKKKSDKVAWYSDPFYTHHKGFEMCISVSFNGQDMLVGLLLKKGPYDEHLKWPLKGRCEVKLLNQINNSEHHLETGNYCDHGCNRVNIGERSTTYLWYKDKFICDADLHKITTTCQYLRDDTVFFRIDYICKVAQGCM
ncbi:TNF receptor-associated factor 2-like [Dysidea avara]|uniref:TNF receptor-associated factor 2-like n=1 Tax=Dysidea avara TaxID=196820 RepID=UPI0033183CA8